MTVISDTTAISNLYQIQYLWLLKELYGTILIPNSVYQELKRYLDLRQLFQGNDWIIIKQIKHSDLLERFKEFLDPGEAEAIILAKETNAELIIIDERKGRNVAKEEGLRIIGILGILLSAKEKGLIKNVKSIIDQLVEEAGFYLNSNVYNEVLEMAGEDN